MMGSSTLLVQGKSPDPWQQTVMTVRQTPPSNLGKGGPRPPESPSHLALQKKLLVPTLQDIQLRVVEFGVLVPEPISLSHVTAPIKDKEGKARLALPTERNGKSATT